MISLVQVFLARCVEMFAHMHNAVSMRPSLGVNYLALIVLRELNGHNSLGSIFYEANRRQLHHIILNCFCQSWERWNFAFTWRNKLSCLVGSFAKLLVV